MPQKFVTTLKKMPEILAGDLLLETLQLMQQEQQEVFWLMQEK